MGVLWSSIGASPAYEMFAGGAESLGGILLIFPRTTLLGALVCLADLTQVFMLNMTYDVPVKLFSFHLILLSLFLLAPDLRRLAAFFFTDGAVPPSAPPPPLFRTRRANRIALAAQIAFGFLLVSSNAYGSYKAWREYGGARPQSPLYGIWNVDRLAIDGLVRSPLLNDYDRWRRVIFDSPDGVSFQRMDDSFVYFPGKVDVKTRKISLTNRDDKNWSAAFGFQRLSADQLVLEGQMGGHRMRLELQLMSLDKLRLSRVRFHWIQEYPYTP